MKYVIDSSTLTGIANAIRSKTGESNEIAVTGMAAAISGISSGPEGIEFGSFTPDADMSTKTITHSLGVAPIAAMLYAENIGTNTQAYCHLASFGVRKGDTIKQGMTFNSYQGYITDVATNYNAVADMTETGVTFNARGGSYLFKAGVKYNYIIVGA